MSEKKQLITIQPDLSVFANDDNMGDFVAQLRLIANALADEYDDMENPEHRAGIQAICDDIVRTRTALVDTGKDRLKPIEAKIRAAKKRIRIAEDELYELKDDIRYELAQWEVDEATAQADTETLRRISDPQMPKPADTFVPLPRCPHCGGRL